jgi:hypothetical protein
MQLFASAFKAATVPLHGDAHSLRVPSQQEMEYLLEKALKVLTLQLGFWGEAAK